MPAERFIGRWAMTALVINCIIGSGIFGVPSELIRLLGRESPLVMIAAALAMSFIAVSLAEVASQFSEPGGLYLYARVAFGRFVGLQVGWFWILAAVGGGAAGANLFLTYLANFLPAVRRGWVHLIALLLLIAIPTIANYLGVRSGVLLSNLLTLVKLLPITILIVIGLLPFAHRSAPLVTEGVGSHTWHNWLSALLLLVFSYGGYEDALVPLGEVREPRRTVPFALGLGLAACMLIYTLLQYVIVSTVGAHPGDSPLIDTASTLIGHNGAMFVAFAVMFSTYGWISAGFLNAPRLLLSFARQGDAPIELGRVHPRFLTPSLGILLYAVAVMLLASTGTFLWVLSVAAGSMMILYAVGCAALIRLRLLRPDSDGFRVPGGPLFAAIGGAISVGLLFQLEAKQIVLMTLTALVATINWLWAKGQPAFASPIGRVSEMK